MIGRIIEKKEVATSTLQVIFQLDQPVHFKAGQYVFLTLPKLLYPDERGNRRQFSINNPPSENTILAITTRLSEGGYKKTLKELPIGAEVELGPIAGVFTLPEDTKKPLVFIAGGIGITPFLSMLGYIRETKKPYQISLVYSNRSQDSAAYLKEIQYLASNTPFKLIATMTEDPNWAGEKRKIDSQFIKDYFPKLNDNLYLVVGPPPMVAAVEKALKEAGVSAENIQKENFTGY